MTRPVVARLEKTVDAGADRALSVFLIGLVAYLFVLSPHLPANMTSRVVLDIVFGVVLFSAIFAVTARRPVRWLTVAVFVIAVAARVGLREAPSPALETMSLVTALAFVALVAGLLFAQVMRVGEITAHRLRGAVAVYLLFGLAWGLGYAAIDGRVGGAFDGAGSGGAGEPRIGELTYFSFVCLTTVGFGDIVPVHPLARNLAILEALTGQIYLAIVITRLVSLAIAGRADPDDPMTPVS